MLGLPVVPGEIVIILFPTSPSLPMETSESFFINFFTSLWMTIVTTTLSEATISIFCTVPTLIPANLTELPSSSPLTLEKVDLILKVGVNRFDLLPT